MGVVRDEDHPKVTSTRLGDVAQNDARFFDAQSGSRLIKNQDFSAKVNRTRNGDGLALTAGFCEEIIFRGYLQKQFAAASGMASIGILAQGVLFGAAHGYQGTKLMFTIGVYGALFGILAAWRKSLRPGMMAHFLQDFISGLLLRFLTQAPR